MSERKTEQEQFNQMVLVPQQLLTEVCETQRRILEVIEQLSEKGKKPTKLIAEKYITEATAKTMLGKGTTWFWQMRKSGKLQFKKLGSSIYYDIDTIRNLIENVEQD